MQLGSGTLSLTHACDIMLLSMTDQVVQQKQINAVRTLLTEVVQEKLETYSRETTYIPFLSGIIQDNDLVAAYSFIQSVATSLGMSVYEQIARMLLLKRGILEADVQLKYKLGGQISSGQRAVIAQIVSDLSDGALIGRTDQVNQVLHTRTTGKLYTPKPSIVDLFYKDSGQEFYVDIKTVKPNIGEFKEYKRKLLEWVARRNAAVNTLIAMPYNPYYPGTYDRFTVKGLLAPGEEMKVGEEFWNSLAGWAIYDDLIQVVNEVGQSLHEEIIAKIRAVGSGLY